MTRIPAPVLAGLGVLAVYAGVLGWAMSNTGYEVWGALIVVPLIIAVNIPLLRFASRREVEEWFGPLLAAAFGLKILGSFARYWMVYGLYGFGDSIRYTDFARSQSALWRDGFFVFDQPEGLVGTHFLELVTTAVYAMTGPSPISAFVVFACLSFWGQYLLYRAFRISLPEFDHRRYAVLLFLLPSLIFWPSSVGKEAFLMLCLGASAFGAARLYRHRLAAMPLLVAGLVGSAMVRPHVTALLVAAALAGLLFRPSKGRQFAGLTKFAGVVLLVVLTIAFADRAAEYVGVDELSLKGVTETVDERGANTEVGGSEFTPVPLRSPLGIPAAFVTVLFRPFPWEVNNIQALVASMESLVLIGLMASSWRRFAALPGLVRKYPYLVFGLVYTLLFIWAFSRFGNFGIIARQRVLVMPFVLVLAALPPIEAKTSRLRAQLPKAEKAIARIR